MWYITAQTKGLDGVGPHRRFSQILRRWQEQCCWDICTDLRSIVIFPLLATIFGVLYYPAICWNISNEIDWESLKNSQKQRRWGRMRGMKTSDCSTLRQMMERLRRSLTSQRGKKRTERQVAYFEEVAWGFCINSRSNSTDTNWHLKETKTHTCRPNSSCINTHQDTTHLWGKSREKHMRNLLV